jgi:hypothetical protein
LNYRITRCFANDVLSSNATEKGMSYLAQTWPEIFKTSQCLNATIIFFSALVQPNDTFSQWSGQLAPFHCLHQLRVPTLPTPISRGMVMLDYQRIAYTMIINLIHQPQLQLHSTKKSANRHTRTFGAMTSARPPPPAYNTPRINEGLYARIRTATKTRTLEYVVPPRSGYAFMVAAGSTFRLTTPEGPQVGDLNLWNMDNPRERFWASRTRQLHASHVSVGDRLWSNLPYLRPLVTIIADSLKDYGVDQFGGRCHDLLGTR